MEKEIFFIGVRIIHSNKKNTDYFIVDYVRLDNKIPKSDFISSDEFDRISTKIKDKEFKKVIGIFNINEHDSLYLCDIK